jgi:hypothetical protein
MPQKAPMIFAQVVPPATDGGAFGESFRGRAPRLKDSAAAFEGFIAGTLMTTALKLAEGDLAKLAPAFASMHDVELGIGEAVKWSEEHHEGSQRIWLLELNDKAELALQLQPAAAH